MDSNAAIFKDEGATLTLKRNSCYGTFKSKYKFSQASYFSLFINPPFTLQRTLGK